MQTPQAMSDMEVQELTIDALVERMDVIRCRAQEERYPHIRESRTLGHLGIGKVADLMSTAAAQQMGGALKRKLADSAFRFLLQMDFVEAAMGISNVVLLPTHWQSPRYWINTASIAQYEIIASRIAL